MNPIKLRIAKFLTGEESASAEDYLAILEDAQELIKAGAENDADAIIYASKSNGKINVAGIVGKSVIQGEDLMRYLSAYFADSGGLEEHKSKIAAYLHKDLQGKSNACTVLKSEDQRWKSFRPIKNIDEVMVGSMDS